MRAAIADTGPLVAFLDRAEKHHRWVAERIEELDTPLLVCEPVLAEAMHLLARFSRAHDALFGLLAFPDFSPTGKLEIYAKSISGARWLPSCQAAAGAS
jgi:predicted nucleic acid-binding protein